MATVVELGIVYAADWKLPVAVYFYDRAGYHRGPVWVESERQLEGVSRIIRLHVNRGHEVRITNSGDELLFRAVEGKVVYDASGGKLR